MLGRETHSLRGAIGLFGESRVLEILEDLEVRIRTNDLDDVGDLGSRLVHEFESYDAFLGELERSL